MLAILLSILTSVQPLSRGELKEFDAAFELLETAKSKGRIDILSKYGPEVLAKYDLIPIQYEPGNGRRDTYDSLSVWVMDAQSRQRLLSALDSLDAKAPTTVATTLARIEPVLDQVVDPVQRNAFRNRGLAIASTVFGGSCSLDTLYRLKGIIPIRIQEALQIPKRVNEGLDAAYRQAFNGGSPALLSYEARFPGVRTNEVRGALEFQEVDQMSGLMRSKSKEALLRAYASLSDGKPKAQIGASLEKILYAEWHGARVHEAEVRAARDFLEVFKNERKKSSRYQEIESWLYFNSGDAPVVAVPASSMPIATTP